MKKFLFLSGLLLLATASNVALSQTSPSELVVAAGSSYQVTAQQQDLKLERLVLGDNSKIEFAPDVSRWHVEAMQAEIGAGVVIDARGEAGRAGSDGESFDQLLPENCDKGRAGSDGGDGESGAKGVDVRLRLGLNRIGDISIDSSGGKGGVGGAGGKGQNLDQKTCEKSDGGKGGNGGQGGDGGDAGNIRISLWANSNFQPAIQDAFSKFTLLAEGGVGGNGGVSGEGGKGSPGKYINRKSLSGNRTWVAGGDDGEKGSTGLGGKAGRSGHVDIEEDSLVARQIKSQSNSVANTAETTVQKPEVADDSVKQLRQEMEAMRAKMQEMQQQLESMEADKN